MIGVGTTALQNPRIPDLNPDAICHNRGRLMDPVPGMDRDVVTGADIGVVQRFQRSDKSFLRFGLQALRALFQRVLSACPRSVFVTKKHFTFRSVPWMAESAYLQTAGRGQGQQR